MARFVRSTPFLLFLMFDSHDGCLTANGYDFISRWRFAHSSRRAYR